MEKDTSREYAPHEFSIIVKSVVVSVGTTLIVLWLVVSYVPSVAIHSPHTSPQEKNDVLSKSIVLNEATIPDIVERVSPAVVSVVISADVPIIERYFEEYNPFNGFFGRNFGFQIPRERHIGTEKREIGGGTGFFVSEDGFIVTNRHVVDTEGASFSIITHEGTTYDATVVAKDPTLDIAILKVESPTAFPYLEFGTSASIRPGSMVIAIGNALAEFPNSISVGVVSGLSRTITATDGFGFVESLEGVIQTDAAINQGNSGGPLLDLTGKVIGVNVAVAGDSENIGFALPIGSVESVYKSVRAYGEIIRPFVGVRYLQITKSIKDANNLPVDYGVLIQEGETSEEPAIIPGSPADTAGLLKGDIILAIDGMRLDGTRTFAGLIREYTVGDTVTLTVLSAGEERDILLTLERAL